MTEIYGGRRCVDYSQFRPRGHYDDSAELRRDFRCLMWLGRADCAWYVLPTQPSDALQVDTDRELRAAVRLARLLESTGQIEELRAIDAAPRLPGRPRRRPVALRAAGRPPGPGRSGPPRPATWSA